MRILGLETSSRRGSVALVDDGRVIASATHEERNAHGEQMLALMETMFSDAGWTRADIDRVAVGAGPGSFTGLRVGLSLGQGIAIGLGLECVGVGSLEAMAAATPASAGSGPRCAVLDALRGELFVAAYDAAGGELLAPRAVKREDFPADVLDALAVAVPEASLQNLIFVGEDESLAQLNAVNDPEAALPHAIWTARLGASRSGAAEPLYVRGADAIKPKMPPDPLRNR